MTGRFQHLELSRTLLGPWEQQTRTREVHHLVSASQSELEGRFEPALQSYSAALRKDASLGEAWAGQVRCLVALEELREAQVWGRKASAVLPADPRTHSALAYALARSELEEEGLSCSDTAMDLAGDQPHPYLWLERAVCLMAHDRWPAAEACLEKLGESRDEVDWRQRQATEYLAFGKAHIGVRLLVEVTARRTDRPYAWLLLGRGYRALGQAGRSEQALAHAEHLYPGWEAVAAERRRVMGWPSWLVALLDLLRGPRPKKGVSHG